MLILTFAVLAARTVFPKKYADCVEVYAEEFGLDSDEVYAVIRAESSFREGAVSHAGALGLMQLMPSTADFCAGMLGLDLTERDVTRPEVNIRLGCYYLSYLKERFDGGYVYAAYNAGEGRVREWLMRGGEIPYEETRVYVSRICLYKKIYKILYGGV